MSLFALFMTCTLHAQEQSSDPASRLEALSKATSLHLESIKPWHLKLSFTLNGMDGKSQDAGTAEVFWQGQGRQKTTIESGLVHGSSEDALNSKDFRAAREAFFVNQLVDETTNPVTVHAASGLDIKETKRAFGKVELSCLSIVSKSTFPIAGSLFPTYCFEQEHPDVLRAKTSGPEQTLKNRMAIFQSTHITMDNIIYYSGTEVITGKIETLETIPADSVDLKPVPPPTSLPQIRNGVTGGRKISGDQPVYPDVARAQHIGGTVMLDALIDKSGHIKRVIPIASQHPSLTEAAVAAVRTWTYQPFLFNGEPTEVDTPIAVNFNLDGAR